MIAGALKKLPELTYLQTYTTRPMREGEEDSHEYVFVDDGKYDERRKAAKEWDHTEYSGYKYGADAGAAKAQLAAGRTVICAVAPDLSVIEAMAELYGIEPITIWIKVPKDVAKQRVYNDDIRDSRNEDFAISTNFDYIFEPIGSISEDIETFAQLLKTVLA